MEYTGLIRKYPINRPLTEKDRAQQLHQKTRLEVAPAYQLSVIRMNSTFMELVDKFYAWKGIITLVMVIGLGMMGLMFAEMLVISLTTPGRMQDDWPYLVGLLIMMLPVVILFIWLLRKESFAYTHYPIRLNRKTRMVHVFRTNGTVLSVPWDEVFFCLGYCSQQMWDIRGYVLDKDRTTVLEAFPLSAIGGGAIGQEVLRSFWEFVRRYMEEGPQEAARTVEIFLPIGERRERVIDGFRRMHAEASGGPAIAMLVAAGLGLLFAPSRWFAMRTSKIPQWPQEIEAVNVVEPNDPYVRDAGTNPVDTR